jgi:hypothetical protein
MQMALRVRHHDHTFIEQRSGWPFYTHLRNGAALAEFRADAVERAWKGYRRAEVDHKSKSEQGGLGLIVIQRALLAAEDLGRLLHAFASENPWIAFRRAGIDDLNKVFIDAVENPEVHLFRMGLLDNPSLASAGLSKSLLETARKLRSITARQWSGDMKDSAGLWLTHAPLARATTHGFPVLAGDSITEPPGAGELAEHADIPEARPFAVAMISTVRNREVTTQLHTVHLDPEMTRTIRNLGREAARLYGQLAELNANCLQAGQEGTLPLLFADRLSERERLALAGEARRRSGTNNA